MKHLIIFVLLVVAFSESAPHGKSDQHIANDVRIKYGCGLPTGRSTMAYFEAMFACTGVATAATSIHAMLTRSFNFLDMNGDGAVSENEVDTRFGQLNAQESTEDRQKFANCDIDGNDNIDDNEYSKCSVLSYAFMMSKVDFDNSGNLSKGELIFLVREFAKVIYTTKTPEMQLRVIDSLGKPAGASYTLHDLVFVDTTLFGQYLDDHNL
uniref:EF-hand domain-containing protein n=1 Tax=Ciona savignyi TaxID=51511 RepID=H2ZQM9_CIOSA